jgi:dephospho-CoA kinase
MNRSFRDIPVIGVVGGIGSGKSVAAKYMEELGALRIDADLLGHQVLEEPQVQEQLRQRWGDSILDDSGKIDRLSIGRLVFEKDEEWKFLTQISWPRIRRRIEDAIFEAKRSRNVPAVVLDAAVLFEAGWDDLCSHIIFVEAPPELRRDRSSARKGWDASMWEKREKRQFSLDKKSTLCYAYLNNSLSVSHLCKQAHQAYNRIVNQFLNTRPE